MLIQRKGRKSDVALTNLGGGGLKFHFSSRLSPGRNPDPVVQLGQIAGILWYWQFILPRVWILLPIRRLWAEHCITCNCYLGGKARENSENPASRREHRSLGRNAAASLWEFSYTRWGPFPSICPDWTLAWGWGTDVDKKTWKPIPVISSSLAFTRINPYHLASGVKRVSKPGTGVPRICPRAVFPPNALRYPISSTHMAWGQGHLSGMHTAQLHFLV